MTSDEDTITASIVKMKSFTLCFKKYATFLCYYQPNLLPIGPQAQHASFQITAERTVRSFPRHSIF
jgi:hypothetical protein